MCEQYILTIISYIIHPFDSERQRPSALWITGNKNWTETQQVDDRATERKEILHRYETGKENAANTTATRMITIRDTCENATRNIYWRTNEQQLHKQEADGRDRGGKLAGDRWVSIRYGGNRSLGREFEAGLGGWGCRKMVQALPWQHETPTVLSFSKSFWALRFVSELHIDSACKTELLYVTDGF